MTLRETLKGWGLGDRIERFEAAGLGPEDLRELTPEELADDLELDLDSRVRFFQGRGDAPALDALQLEAWLDARDLRELAPSLLRAGVTAEAFPFLVASDLRRWREPLSLQDRRRLLAAARALRSPFGPGSGATREELELLDRLPFPVAFPLRFALDSEEPAGLRLDNLILTALQAVRLTTLLLLADYLAAGENAGHRRINSTLCQQLDRPTWGSWKVLCSRLAKHWRTVERNAPGASAFPGLPQAWRRVAEDARGDPQWASLLRGLAGIHSPQAATANDALQRARNDIAHRGRTRSARFHEDEQQFRPLRAVVVRMLEELFAPGRVELYRCSPQGVDRLRGPQGFSPVSRDEVPSSLRAKDREPGLFACGSSGKVVVLHPLAHSFEPRFPAAMSERLTRDLGLLDGLRPRCAVYTGVADSVELEQPANELLTRFRALGISVRLPLQGLPLAALVERSHERARDQLDLLRGRRYFPKWYWSRPEAEELLRRHLSGETGKALLLLGPSGSGKSSLLAHFVEQRVGDTGGAEGAHAPPATPEEALAIVYLLGHTLTEEQAFLSPARALCEAFCVQAGVQRHANWELPRVLDELRSVFRHGGRLLLAIDGLNEALGFEGLAAALSTVVERLAHYPWLRVVVTLRDDVGERLEALPNGPFSSRGWRRFPHTSADGRQESRPAFLLGAFEDDELEAAYRARQERSPERSCRTPFAELEGSLRRALRSPLRHHLFHLAYAGQPAPGKWDGREAATRVLSALEREHPDLSSVLERAGSQMFADRRAVLSRSFVDEVMRRWAEGLSPSERVVCLNPFEVLEGAGLLLRPSQSADAACAYAFAHEHVAEQLLLAHAERVLWGGAEVRREHLLRMSEYAAGVGRTEAEPFAPLLAALAHLWRRHVVDEGDVDALETLLQLDDAPHRARLLTEVLLSLFEPGREGSADLQERALEALYATEPGEAAARFERLDEGTWRAQVALARRGKAGQAARLARRRTALVEAALGERPGDTALARVQSRSLTHLASILRRVDRRGTEEERRALLERALEFASAEGGCAAERAFVLGELSRSHDLPTACAYAQEAVELLRAWHEEDREDPARREALAFALNGHGNFLVRLARKGDEEARSKAIKAHKEAKALVDGLRAADSAQADEILAFAFGHLAELEQLGGHLVDAYGYARCAQTVGERALEQRPRKLSARATVAYAEYRLASVQYERGKPAEARTHAQEALRRFEELRRDAPHRQRYANASRQTQEFLARLEGDEP